MKINPNNVLKDLRGKPLKDGENDMTLGDIIAAALTMTASKDESGAKQSDVVKRWKLALRFTDVKNGQHVEVTPEELVKIKACLADMPYLPLATGQAISMLGGE